MSRSGYSYDCSGWDLVRWRGAVNQAIKGKRGQQFLRDLVTALDAIPGKRLVANVLEEDGEVCALGSVGKARGIDMGSIDLWDDNALATAFGISPALTKEIMYENDEAEWKRETPEERWTRVREWAVSHIKPQQAQP